MCLVCGDRKLSNCEMESPKRELEKRARVKIMSVDEIADCCMIESILQILHARSSRICIKSTILSICAVAIINFAQRW